MIPNPAPPSAAEGEAPAGPILVLVAAPLLSRHEAEAAAISDGGLTVLGLSLIQRTVMAAQRAGYRQVFFLEGDHAAPPGVATISNWRQLDAASALARTAPVIIAPAPILSEVDWLERLAETRIDPAVWAATPRSVVMLAGATATNALEALDAEGGAVDLASVQDRLTRHFGLPPAIATPIDPMIVTGPSDVRAAERRLLRGLVKDTDGFMARNVERPISLEISRRLAFTAVTPNQMSVISIAIGIAGAPFFLSAHWLWQTVGALLFLAHSILDGCDGELARLKFQESRWGGILDFWGDNVVHVAVFACMAVGWSRSAGATWPLFAGAAAVLGSLGSASFVYWRIMRFKEGDGPLFTSVSAAPDGRLSKLLDGASRRDFIYLVLGLALFGKSNWFLLLAALGAPIFLFLLVFIAVREANNPRPFNA